MKGIRYAPGEGVKNHRFQVCGIARTEKARFQVCGIARTEKARLDKKLAVNADRNQKKIKHGQNLSTLPTCTGFHV